MTPRPRSPGSPTSRSDACSRAPSGATRRWRAGGAATRLRCAARAKRRRSFKSLASSRPRRCGAGLSGRQPRVRRHAGWRGALLGRELRPRARRRRRGDERARRTHRGPRSRRARRRGRSVHLRAPARRRRALLGRLRSRVRDASGAAPHGDRGAARRRRPRGRRRAGVRGDARRRSGLHRGSTRGLRRGAQRSPGQAHARRRTRLRAERQRRRAVLVVGGRRSVARLGAAWRARSRSWSVRPSTATRAASSSGRMAACAANPSTCAPRSSERSLHRGGSRASRARHGSRSVVDSAARRSPTEVSSAGVTAKNRGRAFTARHPPAA